MLKKENNSTIFEKIVYAALFLGIFASPLVFAKYLSEGNAADSASVASFIINDTASETVSLDLSTLDGLNPVTYTFIVANYDTSGRLEVATDYEISLAQAYDTLPLNFKLTKGSETTNLLDSDNTYSSSFGYTADESVTYHLTISLPETAYDSANLLDEAILTIESTQRN